jgi:hypothetical protein
MINFFIKVGLLYLRYKVLNLIKLKLHKNVKQVKLYKIVITTRSGWKRLTTL